MNNDEIQLSVKHAKNKSHLEWAHKEITKNFTLIGIALKDVHDKQSWDIGLYHSFEDYCKQVWGISRSQSFKVLKGETVRMLMMEDSHYQEEISTLSTNAVIELSKVEPEQRNEVIEQIKAEGKVVTASAIADKSPKQERTMKQAKAKTVHTCPSCGVVF